MPEAKPHRPVVETIARYLLLWDPIGAIPNLQDGLPLSEYDSYVGPLYTLLANGGTVEDVEKYLTQCLKHMGMTFVPERDKPVALGLHKYFNENSGFRK